MSGRGLPFLRLLLAVALWTAVPGWGGARGAEGAPPAPGVPPPAPAAPLPSPSPAPAPDASPEARAARAVSALASPFFLEREEAAATLVRLGSAARPTLVSAWKGASEVVRPLLARVLAAQGSPEAYVALRDALVEEKSPPVARAIVRALLAHPDAAAHALEGVRGEDGSLPLALAPVETLVRRARVERLFVSRKSRSGSTGSYPGQYDVLRPERVLAVEVCLAILRNEGIKEPSVFPGGSFTFLRPPEFLADGLEFRHMAANALAELVNVDDVKVLDALEGLYYQVRVAITDGARRVARRARLAGRGALLLVNPFKGEEGLLDTGVLPTLARNREAEWRPKAEARIGQLEAQGDYDAAAGLCLRLAEYGRAVGYFAEELRRRDSPVLAHYNIACAYSRWSLDEAERPADRADYRRLAVRSLVSSVVAGYADWPWIEQDRDLDAIRDEPVYKELLKKLKREYPPRGAAAAVPEEPRMPEVPPATAPPGPAMEGGGG